MECSLSVAPHFSLIGVPSRLDSTVLRRCGLESSRQEVADLNAFHLGKYGQNPGLAGRCLQESGFVHRANHDEKFRPGVLKFACCTQPVEDGHPQIKDYDVRVNRSGFLYCFRTVAGLKHNPTGVPFQNCPQFSAPERTVVGDENAYGNKSSEGKRLAIAWRWS